MRLVMGKGIEAKVEPPATIRVYMSPSDGMASLSMTEVELPAGSSTGDHRHDNDQLVYVLEGEARFVGEGEDYHLREGDLIYIPAGTLHRHDCVGAGVLRQLSIFVAPSERST